MIHKPICIAIISSISVMFVFGISNAQDTTSIKSHGQRKIKVNGGGIDNREQNAGVEKRAGNFIDEDGDGICDQNQNPNGAGVQNGERLMDGKGLKHRKGGQGQKKWGGTHSSSGDCQESDSGGSSQGRGQSGRNSSGGSDHGRR